MLFQGELVLILGGLNSEILLYIYNFCSLLIEAGFCVDNGSMVGFQSNSGVNLNEMSSSVSKYMWEKYPSLMCTFVM